MRGRSETQNLMSLFHDKLMILLYKCCFRSVTILWWKCGKCVVFFWPQIWIWSLFPAILWLVKKSMPKFDDECWWWKCTVYLPLFHWELVEGSKIQNPKQDEGNASAAIQILPAFMRGFNNVTVYADREHNVHISFLYLRDMQFGSSYFFPV